MNRKYLLMLIAGALLISNSAVHAQDQNNSNSRFVMTLQDNYVQRLKSSGTLQSPVRDDAQGQIAAIQLQFSGTATQPATLVDLQPNVNGNACEIKLDDATIELAKKQPIRINVPAGSVFAKVFLLYDQAATDSGLDLNAPPAAGFVGESAGSATKEPELSAGSAMKTDNTGFYQHYVQLSNSETVVGQMDLAQEIKFDTKFGEVKISVAQIAGVRFHIDGQDAAMVILKNGDSITGTPTSETFELTTSWGRAEFDPVFVEAITTQRGARFRQSTDPQMGARWQLIGN